MSLAWVDLDDPPEPLSVLEGWLGPAERERAGRFRFEVDRRRFVAARGVLRSLLALQVGASPTDVPIEPDRFGKPRLADALGSGLCFSVSHTSGRALYGFATDWEIGVDAEAIRPLSDMDALAREIFTAGELSEWLAIPPESRVEAFFDGWTRKEAFVKALGRGLAFPLDRFEVSVAPGTAAVIRSVETEVGPLSRWSLRAWTPETGYRAALVADEDRPRRPLIRGISASTG